MELGPHHDGRSHVSCGVAAIRPLLRRQLEHLTAAGRAVATLLSQVRHETRACSSELVQRSAMIVPGLVMQLESSLTRRLGDQ